MEVVYNKSFLKVVKKIRDEKLLNTIETAILEIEKAKSITEISNLKKLTGYETFYRVRIGNYRLGIEIENNIVHIVEFQHRKDIYNLFS